MTDANATKLPEQLSAHDWLQIELLVQCGATGRATEWPHLRIALRKVMSHRAHMDAQAGRGEGVGAYCATHGYRCHEPDCPTVALAQPAAPAVDPAAWARMAKAAGATPVEFEPTGARFALGQRVRKTKGSSWQGRIVGTYSTALTAEGYAVESEREPGSVQIYPAAALMLCDSTIATDGQSVSHNEPTGADAAERVAREVASIAHSGGLDGLDAEEAMIDIRRLTLPYWDRK